MRKHSSRTISVHFFLPDITDYERQDAHSTWLQYTEMTNIKKMNPSDPKVIIAALY
jgi:hypothetical protein